MTALPHLEIWRWDNGAIIFAGEADTLADLVATAVMSRADLSRADLSRADLSGANLSGANLSGAYLRWADLSMANLSGADLRWADLSGANLSRADLSGADLSRAYLRWADLSGANLSGANLSGADLSGANLSGAKNIAPELLTPLLMLLDQPGAIRAYKLTTAEGKSPFSSQNGAAQIQYASGLDLSVADANTDPAVDCGAGINLATLDWVLRNWQPGFRVFIAEFTAQDIAAIPHGTDGKFRVRRCRIVAEKDISKLIPQEKKEEATA